MTNVQLEKISQHLLNFWSENNPKLRNYLEEKKSMSSTFSEKEEQLFETNQSLKKELDQIKAENILFKDNNKKLEEQQSEQNATIVKLQDENKRAFSLSNEMKEKLKETQEKEIQEKEEELQQLKADIKELDEKNKEHFQLIVNLNLEKKKSRRVQSFRRSD